MEMNMQDLIRNVIAQLLWQTYAVQVSLQTPFKLVSGSYSPIYINCRALISDSAAMDLITASIHWWCANRGIEADVIAGGETAGIPFAAYVAERLAKPLVYVRKQSKDHGLGSAVEGALSAGQRVLLVEDLITDGASKYNFVAGLRGTGAIVEDCLVVFDRLQGGSAFLHEMGVRLHSLCDMKVTLDYGDASGMISSDDREEVETYLRDPAIWHKIKGFEWKQKT
jgi:orotate phosphoribosyltransferase